MARKRHFKKRKASKKLPPSQNSHFDFKWHTLFAIFLALLLFWTVKEYSNTESGLHEPQIQGMNSNVGPRLKTQRELNLKTRKNWKKFASHRKRIFDIIKTLHKSVDESILIIGSGNCNDLKVKRINELYANMSFVDVDIEATIKSIKRSTGSIPSSFQFFSKDLTGAFHLLDPPKWQKVNEILNSHRWDSGILHDVVISTNVLSQIISGTFLKAYEHYADQERSQETNIQEQGLLAMALRNQHLETMLLNMKIGGRGIVIIDFVNVKTAPHILKQAPTMHLMYELASQGNFFTGLNPFAILQRWQNNEKLANVEILEPWIWGNEFLVYAITFEKHSTM